MSTAAKNKILPTDQRAFDASVERKNDDDKDVPQDGIAMLAPVHGPRVGLLAMGFYWLCGSILMVGAFGLSSIANSSVPLGIVQKDFISLSPVPVGTILRVNETSFQDINRTGPFPTGSESLSDLQSDSCQTLLDQVCTARVQPNTDRVFFLLGDALAIIPQFELPDYQNRKDFQVTYTNNLVGPNSNTPVVMYHFNGSNESIVCAVRRAEYRVASSQDDAADTDSFAFCSRRAYDPTWFCENDVAGDTITYVLKIQRSEIKYLGSAQRQEMYFNPGNRVVLSGASAGHGIIDPIPSGDEYNSGILQGKAPWDVVPAYSCKSFNSTQRTGWLIQAQGMVVMVWKSPQLMWSGALTLWFITTFIAIIQLRFLPYSSIPIGPMYMAKQSVPVVCMVLAVYGNANVQVLTTFLHKTKVSLISGTFYMSLGPAMMASIAALMNSIVIQLVHNPHVVVPARLLTGWSVLNWIIVFVFEREIVPRLSVGIQTGCALTSTTSCVKYEAVDYTFYSSVFLTSLLAFAGSVAVRMDMRRSMESGKPIPEKHSFLQVFMVPQIRELVTGDLHSCMLRDSAGRIVVDPAIMFNKNLVRVSDKYVARTCMLKYVILYECMPILLRKTFSRVIGPLATVVANGDHMTREMKYVKLEHMETTGQLYASAYLR